MMEVQRNDLTKNETLIEKLADSEYKASIERAFLIHIEAWDRNCPQHITPRYSEEEILLMGKME